MKTNAAPSSHARVRLIINADDFGLTRGINTAVHQLAATGRITSASLMANGPGLVDAISIAQQLPHLSIGCHIVLVDGPAVSSPVHIPSLVDRDGNFRSTLLGFTLALLFGRIDPHDIEQEAIAQVRKLQSNGVHVTHIDTHKHTHLFPAVAAALFRAASACHVTAIRNPVEPAAIASSSGAPLLRRLQLSILRRIAANYRQRATQAGMRTTDGVIGIAATGTLNAHSLRAMLHSLPAGTWELVCHPGNNDDALQATGTRLLASRETDRDALHEVIDGRDDTLISFHDL